MGEETKKGKSEHRRHNWSSSASRYARWTLRPDGSRKLDRIQPFRPEFQSWHEIDLPAGGMRVHLSVFLSHSLSLSLTRSLSHSHPHPHPHPHPGSWTDASLTPDHRQSQILPSFPFPTPFSSSFPLTNLSFPIVIPFLALVVSLSLSLSLSLFLAPLFAHLTLAQCEGETHLTDTRLTLD